MELLRWKQIHAIRPTVGDYIQKTCLSRRDTVLLNRLRIGHTCADVPLRNYTLTHCVDLKDVRNKHFVASSIKDLFDSIEAHKIIDFIKDTRFYKQL